MDVSVNTLPANGNRSRTQLELITPEQFFGAIDAGRPDGVHCIVTGGRSGGYSDHHWPAVGEHFAPFAAKKAERRKPAAHSVSAFVPSRVGRWAGRAAANAVACRVFVLDVEGSEEKGGYAGDKAVVAAVSEYVKAGRLVPSYLVLTGSGGMHVYYVLDDAVEPDEWEPRAKALVEFARRHGLKADLQCTTDIARVMRSPGSVHQGTGRTVTAYQWRRENYTLAAWDKLVGRVDAAPSGLTVERTMGRGSVAVNADILGEHPAFSYYQASRGCGAMRAAATNRGRSTPYPVWILALQTAALSTEGRALAHAISEGHPEYDAAKTEQKLDSLTGGPAGCDAWHQAFGNLAPCETCEFRGKIKNPAVQLGAVVETTPPSPSPAPEAAAPAWVGEMNQRYALARHGSRMVVVDLRTAQVEEGGASRSLGFLDVSAFRTALNGRFLPITRPGDKPRPLADAWLAHPQRKQYEGMAFAPGTLLPVDVLNLWQGFAVTPTPADVTPWAEALTALVPDEQERAYVLQWLAWKVQNPGGVPDTILIFTGSKGTGKNSLLEPILTMFGRHGMLADEPELIAGRFTWHLMSLAFAVLDEAVFVGDPRQADRIKSRVTAKRMHYEQKGMDPVAGINRCAYVMLTNHQHVWQATTDERRAVVLETGTALRGDLAFWSRYHTWLAGGGAGALLHHLQTLDLQGFNPRAIPRGDALRRQIEQTALRDPAAVWWHQCLTEGVIRWRDNIDRTVFISEDSETEVDRAGLRLSFEQSAAARGRAGIEWPGVARKLLAWSGQGTWRKVRPRTTDGSREWKEVIPPLTKLREAFRLATGIEVSG